MLAFRVGTQARQTQPGREDGINAFVGKAETLFKKHSYSRGRVGNGCFVAWQRFACSLVCQYILIVAHPTGRTQIMCLCFTSDVATGGQRA